MQKAVEHRQALAQTPILAVKDEDLATAWFDSEHVDVGTPNHEVLVRG